METKTINQLMAGLKISLKIKVKHWNHRLMQLVWIFFRATHIVTIVVCIAPTSLYALLTASGHGFDGPADDVLGDFLQTWIRTSASSWTVCGGAWWHRTHWYIVSNRCSAGFRSGEQGGQSMASIPSSFRNGLHTPATWGRALSCTRRNPGHTAPA